MSRAPWRRVVRASSSLLLLTPSSSRRGVAGRAAAVAAAPRAGAATAMLTGAQMREWDAVPGWCALCSEPVNGWNEHLGKREHVCLGLVYDAVIHAERRWGAAEVWADAHAWLPPGRVSSSYADCRPPLDDLGEAPRSRALLPFFAAHERGVAVGRRRELLLCLDHLLRVGVVQLTRGNVGAHAHAGAMLLYKELFYPLARLFPRAEAKDLSCMTQMVAATFNLGALYELCRFDTLPLPTGAATHTPSRRKTTTTSAAGGAATDGGHEDDEDDDDDDSGGEANGGGERVGADDGEGGRHYAWKGMLCRALFGALRWTFEPAAAAQPPALQQQHSSVAAMADVHAAVAEYAARLMLSELVACKVAEYVVRVTPVACDARGLAEAALFRHAANTVYREPSPVSSSSFAAAMRATERRRLLPRDAVVPTPSNWGMRHYIDDGVPLDSRFGSDMARAALPPSSRLSAVKLR